MKGLRAIHNARQHRVYVPVLFYFGKGAGYENAAPWGRRAGSPPGRSRSRRQSAAMVFFTVSTSCLRLKGLGKKLKASPSGRFLRNASSA